MKSTFCKGKMLLRIPPLLLHTESKLVILTLLSGEWIQHSTDRSLNIPGAMYLNNICFDGAQHDSQCCGEISPVK